MGAHLQMLMTDLARSLVTPRGQPPEVRLRCPVGGELSADIATPLSQIAVELVLNAVKHAGAARNDVVIDVAFHSGSPMRLTVSDNGSGLSAAPRKRGGLGLRLVELLAQQLRGTVVFESTMPGLLITLTVPRPG